VSKTNFDDIQLSTPGIEAAEVNSEAATVGQVLAADGAGGVAWQTRGFVMAYVANILVLDDTSDVAWTDLGLPGRGVPAGAKAVLLAVSIQDSAGNIHVNFRPNGSAWASGLESSPSVWTANPNIGAGTLTVPCGSGEVEYFVNASGVETGIVYASLLGYWL